MISPHSSISDIETLVVGAGLAGLSSAWHTAGECLVIEAAAYPGGTAASLEYGSFHLDRGVHILYFRDKWTRHWIEQEIGVKLKKSERHSSVWFHGKYVPYPLQFHLSELPASDRFSAYSSAVRSIVSGLPHRAFTSDLESWARRNFGIRLSDGFFTPYNEKLYGVPTSDLETSWMSGYVPVLSATAVLKSLLKRNSSGIGANAEFYYPDSGGISALADAIASKITDTRYSTRLTGLDLVKHEAILSDGSVIRYRHLISTMPLAALVECVRETPTEVREYAKEIRSNSLAIAHVLVQRENIGRGTHWIYVPQRDIPFYRITFPHAINSANCPAGWSAITLEFGGSGISKEQAEKRSIDALLEMGMLEAADRPLGFIWEELKHGYVICDSRWAQARHKLLSFFAKNDVVCTGRYGRWEYSNMESALIQGRMIGRRLSREPRRQRMNRQIPNSVKNSRLTRYFSHQYPGRDGLVPGRLFRRGEEKRLIIAARWISHLEGKTVLDAGCGDGQVLLRFLHGRPRLIRLEDLVEQNIVRAISSLECFADVVEGATIDSSTTTDPRRYDVVLALGLVDYSSNPQDLLRRLYDRSRELLIVDIPKKGVVHNALRKVWLRRFGIRLRTYDKSEILSMLPAGQYDIETVDLGIQWIARLTRRTNVCT